MMSEIASNNEKIMHKKEIKFYNVHNFYSYYLAQFSDVVIFIGKADLSNKIVIGAILLCTTIF